MIPYGGEDPRNVPPWVCERDARCRWCGRHDGPFVEPDGYLCALCLGPIEVARRTVPARAEPLAS